MYLRDNLDNVVQCGDIAMEYTVPKCEYCSLTKTNYDKSNQERNKNAEENKNKTRLAKSIGQYFSPMPFS